VFALVAAVMPVSAHHSWPVAMDRLVTVKGTVIEFVWANPHPMMTLEVETSAGREKWLMGGPAISRMEANAGHLTQQLPFGTRVLASVFTPDSYRTVYLHIPDRACIGHCFLVSNYEPSTRQFRVRVQQGSPVVASSVDDSEDMQSGNYEVQEEDLPLKQIYQCDASDLTRICIRDLAEGEKNGRLGYHPRSDSPSSQNP